MSDNETTELKIYEITDRATGKKAFKAATTAYDACKQAGWLIGNCYVIEQKARYKPVPDREPLVLARVPCLTCPFQYAECKKPETEYCPTRPHAPELQEWLKQASESHLCPHVGAILTKKDYQFQQKWLPITEALEELAPKS